MTSKIEQEFFIMFGIDTHYFPEYMENGCKKDCKYPDITAEKLLEMICICNSTYINGYTNYFMSTGKTKELLKEEILKKCLIVKDDIKPEIQQLFKKVSE